MKVPQYIKNNLRKQTEYSKKGRQLTKQFLQWCEFNKIDINCGEFEDVQGYIQGDCTAIPMINYLEYDVILTDDD